MAFIRLPGALQRIQFLIYITEPQTVNGDSVMPQVNRIYSIEILLRDMSRKM